MTSKHVNATLAQADADSILATIAAVREKLPFLIDLNVEERQGMVKFGDKSRPFASDSLTLAGQHPEMLPATFNLAELQRALALYDALNPIRLALEHLLGQIQDTMYSVGSDTYAGALHVYTYAKAANLVTGSLEDALDDLGRRFAHHTRAAKPAATDTSP